MEKKQARLRALPKVDSAVELVAGALPSEVPERLIKKSIRCVIDRERDKILNGGVATSIPRDEKGWKELFIAEIIRCSSYNFKKVFNGTGVVVHTNLGRSLLCEAAVKQVQEAASCYSNLEFDLDTGKRGSRYSLVEEIICDLSGAEAALVVNNNAAAVLLVLETLARDAEVIVSRGQLVEIGGSFRIPDVMTKSGAQLVEVGTTNRTHFRDYEQAITERTRMLLRVHTSNFKVIGFASEVPAEQLAALGRDKGLYTMEDLGSGSLVDLSQYGLSREPTVQDIVKAGIDVVTFSGDKLLGGPQAGIIVGKQEIVSMIRANPMNRALRIDKFTLAALEATLRLYYENSSAFPKIPTLRMLSEQPKSIRKRAQRIARRLRQDIAEKCNVTVVATHSRVGGGAMPDCLLPSWAVSLVPQECSLHELEVGFRRLQIPIIGRIENETYLLDARTIQDDEVVGLTKSLHYYFNEQ